MLRLLSAKRGIFRRISYRFVDEPIKKDRFLRLVDLDAKYLERVPWLFSPLEPFIDYSKDLLLGFNLWAGMPWWMILMGCSFLVRSGLLPLIFLQVRKFSKIAPAVPAFVFIKDTWKESSISKWRIFKHAWRIYRSVSKREGFKAVSGFVYWAAYYPLLITMIFSIRKLVAQPALADATFLHIKNFADMDPYYILPTITIALYYFNFQRHITKENEHTIMTKIRRLCQVFFILWYPYMCCWPAGIVIYMFSNALFSVLQASLMKLPFFVHLSNPQAILYMQMIQRAEYEPAAAKNVVEAIMKGEENMKIAAVKEETLHSETLTFLKRLEKEEHKLEVVNSPEEDQLPPDRPIRLEERIKAIFYRSKKAWRNYKTERGSGGSKESKESEEGKEDKESKGANENRK